MSEVIEGVAPGGESWVEFFRAYHQAHNPETEDEEPEEKFEVTARGLEVDEDTLTATQKRIVKNARALGMEVRLNRATVHYFDKIQKSDGKKAMAGDVIKPAHDVENIFISALYPGSLLRFDAAWAGSPQKFTAHVSDPVGRWVQDEEMSWRETEWMFAGVKAFEAWIKEWIEMAKGAKK